MNEAIALTISAEDHAKFHRLDLYLVNKLPDLSRSVIKNLFENGHIKADIVLSLKKMPEEGTRLEIFLPEKRESRARPEDIPLDILYEDNDLILINKPSGLVIHPAPGNYQGTLVNAILHHCPEIEGVGDEKRPGIVHRLDKGTSGVMVIAKNEKSHRGMMELFVSRQIEKKYWALGMGIPVIASGRIETFFGRHPTQRLKMTARLNKGKKAISDYRVLQQYGEIAYFEITLLTGRTHQIRVHLSEKLKVPILCDTLYAHPPAQIKRLPEKIATVLSDYPFPLLHARYLKFMHPVSKFLVEVVAQPPSVFVQVLNLLDEEYGKDRLSKKNR